MYADLTTEELQAWLLSESISDDTIYADDETFEAAQAFRRDVQDAVYLRQYPISDDELLAGLL